MLNKSSSYAFWRSLINLVVITVEQGTGPFYNGRNDSWLASASLPSVFVCEANMRPDLSNMRVNEEILKILADTCKDILNVAHYELTHFAFAKQKHDFETYGIAYDMPNILLQYGFTTIDELNEPSLLERIIDLPDPEIVNADKSVVDRAD